MKTINAKLGKMRKVMNWVVYPFNQESEKARIQTDTYIAEINLKTGEGILAGPHAGGAYFHHLVMGKRQTIQISPELLEEIKAANPQSGTLIGPGVRIA